jgi:uncharacterized membrane protein YgaE (UPF0421/DUF939 family)
VTERLHLRLQRLRATSPYLAQAALASALAWLIATEAVGHETPFFAPISAILVLGLSAGQRGRRAVETAAGVALGIFVGDVLVNLIGGGTWQLIVIVPLAMVAAVMLNAPAPVVTQTGVSAVLVVILEQPEGFSFARSIDVIVGGASALLFSFVVLPIDPLRLIRTAAQPILGEMAGTLEDVAKALRTSDREQAVDALRRARAADPLAHSFEEALAAGRETAIASPSRRSALQALEAFGQAGAQLDLAVRNVRVIARGSLRAIEVGDHVPPPTTQALQELAEATRAFGAWLNEDAKDPQPTHAHAVKAAQHAQEVLETTANLSVSIIVGAVRSAAVDIIRATGVDRDDALRLVRARAA